MPGPKWNNFATISQKISQKFAKCPSGVAAIEFAITMPVLIMLLAGSINFGHVIFVKHSMQSIAGETLRSVSYGLVEQSSAIDSAKEKMRRLVREGTTVTINENVGANEITVTITQTAKAATLMPLPFVSADVFADNLTVNVVAPRITAFDQSPNPT
ncbi:MAG: TadE/TadG family type IV pilus assembly protein [Pseudomonadota bacterium]